MGFDVEFELERKDSLKGQIKKVTQGESSSVVIDNYVTEDELKEIFDLGSLTSLDISFLLISKNVIEDDKLTR